MIRSIFCAALLATAAFAAQSVSAQERTPDQMAVSTRGLDLNKPADARQLDARLQLAANAVCHSDFNDPATADADAACATQAVADARQALGRQTLARTDDTSEDRAAARTMTVAMNRPAH